MAITVLVSSAGTAHAVSIIKSLKLQQEEQITVVAVDLDPTAAGLALADVGEVIPPASAAEYPGALESLIDKHRINVFFPTHSKEIEVVARLSPMLEGKGVKMLLAPLEAIRICNDKRAMNTLVSELQIPVPEMFESPTADVLPVIIKPNSGSGTNDVTVARTEQELRSAVSSSSKFLAQKFIEGDEYTVDCLADRAHQLIVASPRSRLLVKAGQSVKARTEAIPVLQQYCQRIAEKLRFAGPFNVQFIKQNDTYYFIEMNPRYAAGGLMLTVRAGANIPHLALKIIRGEKVDPVTTESGVLMVRYWEELIFSPSGALKS